MEQIRHDLSTQHNNSKNLDKPRNKIYRSCLIITHEKYTNVNTSDGVLKKITWHDNTDSQKMYNT